MIVFVSFEVGFDGMKLSSAAELEHLRQQIETAVRVVHPNLKFPSDVWVDVIRQTTKNEAHP